MPSIRLGNERKRKNMFEPRAKVSSDLVSDEQLNKAKASICDDTRMRRGRERGVGDSLCHPIDNRADRIDCRHPVPISRESFRFFPKR